MTCLHKPHSIEMIEYSLSDYKKQEDGINGANVL